LPPHGGALAKMRHAVHTAEVLMESVEALEDVTVHEREEEPKHGKPPPIRQTRRPLRRRIGPAWACVTVIQEQDEKGPCESLVMCKFCGCEWLTDEARIREHLNNYQPEQQKSSTELSKYSLGKFMDEIDGSGTAKSATASSVSSEPSVAEVAPPPPCSASLTLSSYSERTLALEWIANADFLQFTSRAGIAITEPVARAMRNAEKADALVQMYHSQANMKAAADAASEAVQIAKHSLAEEWHSVDRISLAGYGIGDDDCAKLSELIKSSGGAA